MGFYSSPNWANLQQFAPQKNTAICSFESLAALVPRCRLEWLILRLAPRQAAAMAAENAQQKNMAQEYLVGGWPTPLKNDGVRQLGLWNSQYMEK